MLKQGRGAVGRVDFSTVSERRALLNITMADGSPLPRGVPISDAEGNYLTTSVDDGIVFLNNVKAQQTLTAQLDNGSCEIALSLAEEANPDAFYDTSKGVCK